MENINTNGNLKERPVLVEAVATNLANPLIRKSAYARNVIEPEVRSFLAAELGILSNSITLKVSLPLVEDGDTKEAIFRLADQDGNDVGVLVEWFKRGKGDKSEMQFGTNAQLLFWSTFWPAKTAKASEIISSALGK